MTPGQALAILRDQYPDLPPDAAPVFLLLCAHDVLTMPGIARRLDMAQSTTSRLLSFLAQSGLASANAAGAQSPRWALSDAGRTLAEKIAASPQ